MNKFIGIGNITKDVEVRKTQNGKSVVEFSIASNERYGDKEVTDYINCVAWEKLADVVGNFCGKGSKIFVEGKIKTDSYEKNGQKIYRTFVLVSNIEFMGGKKETPIEKDNKVNIQPEELPFY